MSASYRALAACVPVVGGDVICSHRRSVVFDSLVVGRENGAGRASLWSPTSCLTCCGSFLPTFHFPPSLEMSLRSVATNSPRRGENLERGCHLQPPLLRQTRKSRAF